MLSDDFFMFNCASFSVASRQLRVNVSYRAVPATRDIKRLLLSFSFFLLNFIWKETCKVAFSLLIIYFCEGLSSSDSASHMSTLQYRKLGCVKWCLNSNTKKKTIENWSQVLHAAIWWLNENIFQMCMMEWMLGLKVWRHLDNIFFFVIFNDLNVSSLA